MSITPAIFSGPLEINGCDVVRSAFTAEIGLVGLAIGYYFGEKAAK